MTDFIFVLGILGALTLVSGAAYPVKAFSHPIRSTKNWLFAIGGFLMLIYAILNFLYAEGAVFYILLQGLVNISSIMMLAKTDEHKASKIIAVATACFILWSINLAQGTNVILFILGLGGIATGYVLKPGTSRRNLSLTIGSLFIVLFSYLVSDWIFFGLNSVFACFSGYYSLKLRNKNVK